MTDNTTDMEDEREIELSSISAIFPEIALEPLNPFVASIDLPVAPSLPLSVVFPEPSEGPTDIRNDPDPQLELDLRLRNNRNEPEKRLETHRLSHLPGLHLRIDLPKDYPSSKPPLFNLSTTPQWLSPAILERLQSDGVRLWEELGHDQVVFAYIDHLQQSAENAFGLMDGNEPLQVAQDLKIALLDFDINAKREAFEKETFTCGVCLDPKKGSACHRLIDCTHVFCRQCLQDFYNNAITEGDLASVKCLAPNCAKQRSDAAQTSPGKHRKPKARISPSELLQIPIEQEMVKRYVTLKHKAELESDKNTIYCPRKWCQGAARSRKHRKPSQFLNTESSEDESEIEDGTTEAKAGYKSGAELLSVCEDCSFAFCSRCYQGWHGEFLSCAPRTNTGELTEEDKASLEYLKRHTTPCPTCAAPVQKTHGCNHMVCFRCETHFCYLCSAWLSPANPYRHYNLAATSCYMRLFEQDSWEVREGEDGNDFEVDFAAEEQELEAFAPQAGIEAIINEIGPEEPPANPVQPLDQPIAREGPLVLRIGYVPPRVPPALHQEIVQNLPQNRRRGRHQANAQPARMAYAARPAGGRHAQYADHQRRLGADQRGRNARPAQNLAPQAVRHGGPRAPRVAAPHVVNAPEVPAEGAAEANAQQRWVENFVRLALADEEDLVEWDSDDDDDDEWRIPVR